MVTPAGGCAACPPSIGELDTIDACADASPAPQMVVASRPENNQRRAIKQ